MPQEQGDREQAPERRMSLRRARSGGGFSPSASTHLETLRDLGEEDDLEGEQGPPVDPSAVVRLRAPALPPPADDADRDMDNRQRLAEAAMAGDPEFAREFRLNMLHRLLLRNISLDNIARELGVSLSTVKNDRAELRRRLRAAATQLDVNELIGGQMAFYDEVTAMALRVSSQQGAPTAMRLASMRTALAAKADQTRFLTSAGVFDVMAFRRTESGENLSDVQVLMQQTGALLERLLSEDGGARQDPGPEDPPPSASRRVIRRRAGGFSGMTFDDTAASGSSEETVEL